MKTQHYLCSLFLLFSGIIIAPVVNAQSTSWVSFATQQVKLDTALTRRIYIADINNDHYPDLITIRGPGDVGTENNLQVYINIQDTSSSDPHQRMFVNITDSSGVNVMPDTTDTSRSTSLAALADVNNDGNIDIVRGNYFGATLNGYVDHGDRCEVLLGDGMGHFKIVPHNGLHELGLTNPMGFSFLDYNKDGNIDLFIANWFLDYPGNVWQTGILMKGNGDGTFTNVTASAGINEEEPMFGCTAVDWNNDGWPDIATAPYCRTGGQLWKNKGDGTFEDVASTANYNAKVMQGDNGQNLCMWGSMPEDFDNDGDMDFFFSLVHGGNDPNEGHSTIVVNEGAAKDYHLDWDLNRITWNNPKSPHHGDYDASWFDLDNDGLEDIVMTQGHYVPATDRLYVFYQHPDHSFSDITQALGLLDVATQNTHMVEVLDYDLDGDDDILFCNVQPTRLTHLIENKTGQDNNWIGVRLAAPPGVNKDCIGARITLWTGGVRRIREVYAGRANAAGQQPFAMLFGLGHNTSVDSVQVRWPAPGNPHTTVKNPSVNQYITITDSVLVGIHETVKPLSAVTMKVYPNPAKDFLLLQLSDNSPDLSNVVLYDLSGRVVKELNIQKDQGATKYCSLNHLAAGTYCLKATTKDGTVYSQLFIKK